MSTKADSNAVADAATVPRLTEEQRLELAACYAEFCGVDPQDRDEWRSEMVGAKKFVREPFLDGSLTYATDGRWIIRGELEGVATDGQGRRRPPVQALFERWQPGPMAAFEMPRIADLEMSLGVCPACRDRRVSVAEQDWERYAYDLDFDPDDCTIGDRTCSHCWDAIRDRPRDEFPCIVRIDGVRLMAASVQQILEIPGVRVRGVPDFQQIPSKETVGALQFEGCGFQGMLAGVARGVVV